MPGDTSYKSREPKFTQGIAELLCTLAGEGMPRIQAAKFVGISHRTLCRWLNDEPSPHPEFADAYRKAEMSMVRQILPVAIARDPWAYLGRRFPAIWGKKRDEHKPATPTAIAVDKAELALLIAASQELRKK